MLQNVLVFFTATQKTLITVFKLVFFEKNDMYFY